MRELPPQSGPVSQALSYLDGVEHTFSTRWRENANRRTILIIIILGLLSVYAYLYLIRPPDQFPVHKIVSIPAGQSGAKISEILQADGVVRSAPMFRIMTFLQGHARSLHAGDYLFKQPLDVFHVARTIGIGAYGLEPQKIRIDEGATIRDMATLYSIELPDFNAQNFLAQAQSMEGYLFPDTYYFLPNANENTVIEAMRQNFDQHVASIEPQIESFGKPLNDDVIMASIIEREADNTQDRRMIAGVLWNRTCRRPISS